MDQRRERSNSEIHKMGILASGDSSSDVQKSCRVRKMYAAAFAVLMMDMALGMASGYSAQATYDMKSDPKSSIKPSLDEMTWIGSIIGLGLMLGGFLTGPLTDTLGRKHTLMMNIPPYVFGWGLIFYAENIAQILVGRFLCGMCCGVIAVTVPMYTVEISTPEVRGLLGSACQTFLVTGNFIAMVAGSALTWRWLAFCGACLAVAAMLALLPMPESPRWLVAQERLKEAVAAVDFLQGDYLDSVEECRIIQEDLRTKPKGRLSFLEFRHPSVYKPTLLAFGVMFFMQFCGANAVFFYSTYIFDVSKNIIDPKIATVVLAAVQVIATLLSNVVMDRAGRRILLLSSGILMAISLAALGAYYYMSYESETFRNNFGWLPLSSLSLLTVAYSIGYGPIPPLLVAEMVPLRARGVVSGLSIFALGIFAFIVTKTFSELETALGTHGTFWTYGTVSLASCFFVFFLVPETKGKRLEDIASLFSNEQPLEIESPVYSINYAKDI